MNHPTAVALSWKNGLKLHESLNKQYECSESMLSYSSEYHDVTTTVPIDCEAQQEQ